MKHPVFLEDFAVCMRELSTLTAPGVTAQTMLRLSRADRRMINSLARQVQQEGIALTHSQSELIKTLVHKYERQLVQHTVEAKMVDQALPYRPLRSVDKRKRLWLEQDMLHIIFPYDDAMFRTLNIPESQYMSTGRFFWNQQLRRWDIAPTEPNIERAVDFARRYQLEIDPAVQDLYQQVQQFRLQHPEWCIRLEADGCIKNAAPELLNYLDQLGYHDLATLADRAYDFGYEVDQSVWSVICQQVNHTVSRPELMMSAIRERNITLTDTLNNILDFAIQYVELTRRGPIFLVDDHEFDSGVCSQYNIKNVDGQDLQSCNREDIIRMTSTKQHLSKIQQLRRTLHHTALVLVFNQQPLLRFGTCKVWQVAHERDK
jgi:hypothetical protein